MNIKYLPGAILSNMNPAKPPTNIEFRKRARNIFSTISLFTSILAAFFAVYSETTMPKKTLNPKMNRFLLKTKSSIRLSMLSYLIIIDESWQIYPGKNNNVHLKGHFWSTGIHIRCFKKYFPFFKKEIKEPDLHLREKMSWLRSKKLRNPKHHVNIYTRIHALTHQNDRVVCRIQ